MGGGFLSIIGAVEFLPFAIGGAAAALVCWRPLGLVRGAGLRRALRSFAIACGVAPAAVTSPGLFIGFVVPAALELADGVAHANTGEIIGGSWPIILAALIVWGVWSAAAAAASRLRHGQSPRR